MKSINIHISLLEYKPCVIQEKTRNAYREKVGISGYSQEKVRKTRYENCVATLLIIYFIQSYCNMQTSDLEQLFQVLKVVIHQLL